MYSKSIHAHIKWSCTVQFVLHRVVQRRLFRIQGAQPIEEKDVDLGLSYGHRDSRLEQIASGATKEVVQNMSNWEEVIMFRIRREVRFSVSRCVASLSQYVLLTRSLVTSLHTKRANLAGTLDCVSQNLIRTAFC
jgi:hypothetical protein